MPRQGDVLAQGPAASQDRQTKVHTQRSFLQVPEFRVAYTVTTDKLDTLYKKLKPKGVTMTALLAKAAGVALSKHPVMYAGSISNDNDSFQKCCSSPTTGFCLAVAVEFKAFPALRKVIQEDPRIQACTTLTL